MGPFITGVLALDGSTARSGGSRRPNRLRRHLAARREMGRDQRAERYVAHMPTAVLGAC
ncbi:hypothetical protein [Mycolicibacter hiberniae]|uniref:Uncharacterized protein n=1 Tax=Mycolicibacter hiberniae TaxID=29314 RepID=A0A7I7X889_9MYCO|nr:hypothetical protein [Mycolicibacter hiberniae]MCV7088232.1 hypothetical protein [Mycolicibacter hiberniae]BBZ25087.1 hypothetical protein MHIB_35050 [Mycolicibacter hiberniae]